MQEDHDVRQELVRRIQDRRATVAEFLARTRPKRQRLVTLSIIGSAVAAVLTAGPGIGGESFAGSAQQILSLPSDSIVWRVLCLGALVASLIATIATSLSNSQEIAARVTAAETCAVELEGLETSLVFGRVSLDQAVELYQQYSAKVPFVSDRPVNAAG